MTFRLLLVLAVGAVACCVEPRGLHATHHRRLPVGRAQLLDRGSADLEPALQQLSLPRGRRWALAARQPAEREGLGTRSHQGSQGVLDAPAGLRLRCPSQRGTSSGRGSSVVRPTIDALARHVEGNVGVATSSGRRPATRPSRPERRARPRRRSDRPRRRHPPRGQRSPAPQRLASPLPISSFVISRGRPTDSANFAARRWCSSGSIRSALS